MPRGSESNEFKACCAFSGSQGGPFSDTFLDPRGLECFLDFETHLKANLWILANPGNMDLELGNEKSIFRIRILVYDSAKL